MPLRPDDNMGLAVIMFGSLLAACVVMVTVVTYGIEKESQLAPLDAVNDYAAREGGKMQTGLTIVNTCLTCLSGTCEYTNPPNPNEPSFHVLNLTIKNNGSIVLNSTKVTVLYNTSYIQYRVTSAGNVWTPLTNASLEISNIYLDPKSPPPTGPELMLLVAAENGVSANAPTSPTNFIITFDKGTYTYSWNASKDDEGIDYYLIYEVGSTSTTCPITPMYIHRIDGNKTGVSLPCTGSCSTTYFFMTAVDLGGNMAIQSRTLRCAGASGNCKY